MIKQLSFVKLEISVAIRQAGERAVKEVVPKLPAEYAEKGAFLRAYVLPNLEESYIGLVNLYSGWIGGQSNNDEIDKYLIVSVEKAIRLASNAKKYRHMCSWESRDPETFVFREKFGGAILVRCSLPTLDPDPIYLLLSVSGLNEKGDEAIALYTATFLQWKLNCQDLYNILLMSSNEIATGVLPGWPSTA